MGLVEASISMSVDGFITGPDEPGAGLGSGGDVLHYWFTKDPAAPELLDDALFATAGAVVTSRKIYDGMNGWGDTGFYRMPVFVLTHRPRDVVVKGDTTFTFVTGGIESAITQARAAAGEKNVHIMGGASIIQQALAAGRQPAAAPRPGRAHRRHETVRKPHRADLARAHPDRRIATRHPPQIPGNRVAPAAGFCFGRGFTVRGHDSPGRPRRRNARCASRVPRRLRSRPHSSSTTA